MYLVKGDDDDDDDDDDLDRSIDREPRMPPPLRAFGVAFFSALAGASVVHNYYAPDLSIPTPTTPTKTKTTRQSSRRAEREV